jgi:hypothetical protein
VDIQNLKLGQALPDSVSAHFLPMNRRRRMLLVIRFRWVDALIVMALFAVMVSAVLRWPEKLIADIAIPTAFLIAFMVWRDRWW